MRRWPTVEELAAATEDEVLGEWQGLGYYSRARNLHFAARQVVDLGGFPRSYDGLRQLKGVGDYTAAAIASFAFGDPIAAVDGNVYRVLSRVFGIDTPIDSTHGKKEFTALANSLVPKDRPADFNQAMMDFGATQCVPNGKPDCTVCPLLETCVARRENRIDSLPVKAKKTNVTLRRLTYIYIRCGRQTAIRRRTAGDIWQGLWEPLLTEYINDYAATGNLQLVAKDMRHQLTHRTLVADFYLLTVSEKPQLPNGYIWIDETELDRFAKPRLIERMVELLRSEE